MTKKIKIKIIRERNGQIREIYNKFYVLLIYEIKP